MSWIHELVELHKELESPRAFWYWAGLTAISAVMKDSVWLDRGGAYKLYPNIYTMLHADSGMKKGPPVGLAKDLVKRVGNTRIISGRSSIQGILKELGTTTTQPGGKVVGQSVGFIVASEFSSSIVADPAAMTILTDLYDRQYNDGEWKSLLKMEAFQLKNPTISMLVATNDAHFEDFVQAKDMKGGFIGRMFVIAETETQTLNPLIKSLSKIPDRDMLAQHLIELSKVTGPFQSLENTTAGKFYEDWYLNFYKTIREQGYKDDTGTVQRFGDSLLKVAMLISLADTTEKIITETHMIEAVEVCEKLIGNIRRTTLGKRGMSSYASHKKLIIEEVLRRETFSVSRAYLLHRYWMNFNEKELDEIMLSFDSSGMIKTKTIGNQIIYEMPADQVEQMRKYLSGRSR